MEAFNTQLKLETTGQIPVPAVLPYFEEMLREAPAMSPGASSTRVSERVAQQRGKVQALHVSGFLC